MPKEFKHQSLKDPETSIRLLRILPGAGDTKIIQCGLTQAPLASKPYYCLSYTWSPDKPRHQILINGASFQVGDNLWQFLRAARFRGLSLPLWIDAICINQTDREEKNRQVKRMRDIYGCSERTLIWLGSLSKSVLLFLTDIAPVAERSRLEKGMSWDYGTRSAAQDEFRAAAIAESSEESRINMTTAIFSAAYWSRMWIVQEVILSPAAAIFTGTEEVDIDCLSIFLGDTREAMLNSRGPLEETCLLAWRLLNWRQTRLEKASNTPGAADTGFSKLSTLFPTFSTSGAQNPVDRVFALLALAKNTKGFTVEYAWKAQDVFRYTVEFCMDGTATVDELLLTGAHLLETLELLRSPGVRRSVTYGGSRGSNVKLPLPKRGATFTPGDAARAPVRFDGFSAPGGGVAWALSNLVWSDAMVQMRNDAGDDVSAEVHHEIVLFAVRDGKAVHVFEYAIARLDDTIGRWVVRYARAHEYLRGEARMGEEDNELHVGCRRVGFWAGVPSEEAWYFDGPYFAGQQRHAAAAAAATSSRDGKSASRGKRLAGDLESTDLGTQDCLWSWSVPTIELGDTAVHKGRQSRLEPSTRSASAQAEPWSPMTGARPGRVYPRWFASTRAKMETDVRAKITDPGNIFPRAARPTTFFLRTE